MNNHNLFDSINSQNQKLWELLNFRSIMGLSSKAVISKIIESNIFPKYTNHFIIDGVVDKEFYDDYMSRIYNFYDKKLKDGNPISVSLIDELYDILFSTFLKKDNLESGFRSKTNGDIFTVYEGRRINYSHSQFVIRDLEAAVVKFNGGEENVLQRIFDLCTYSILMKIHPFSDANFAFSSILTDLLLLRSGHMPIGLKKINKRISGESKEDALNDFLSLMKEKYSDYRF